MSASTLDTVFVEDFGIRIDRAGDVPVGVQLDWALRGAIESGVLRAGDRLPPLRELAGEVGVNANTLRAAYVKLEADGLIETRHGSGTYVTGGPDRRDLSPLVSAASRAARDAGVDPRDLAAALYVSSREEREPDTEAHRRRALRADIATLERMLAERAPPPAGAPERHPRGPRLLTTAELEEVRDRLIARLAGS
ncbi:MAG TPA: GntR family transcriptional regulator [Solirubrobacteraceae bacterium]|nr:GntR family transcriptional regulator [Solirubrobacteraceae bacterium]